MGPLASGGVNETMNMARNNQTEEPSYQLPTDCPYSVTKVKSFRGMEGQGFNATLLKNGAKVAFVIDEGNGGCYRYEWADGFRETPESEAFAAYAKSLPPMPSTFAGMEPLDMHDDLLVSILVDRAEIEKKMRNWCKKKTVVQIGNDIGTDVYTTFKVPWTEETKPKYGVYFAQKYPGQRIRILNEEVA